MSALRRRVVGWSDWHNPELKSPGELRFNHLPGGSNVLYMDGHVAFVRFDEGYPCTLESPFTGDYLSVIEFVINRSGGSS